MANIGYWFGEYDTETKSLAKMVAELQSPTLIPTAQNALVMQCDTKINRIR
jgi:hypothetical protein